MDHNDVGHDSNLVESHDVNSYNVISNTIYGRKTTFYIYYHLRLPGHDPRLQGSSFNVFPLHGLPP